MTDIQSYQFDPEETLQNEDDSDCFEESRNIKESVRRTGNTKHLPSGVVHDYYCLLL